MHENLVNGLVITVMNSIGHYSDEFHWSLQRSISKYLSIFLISNRKKLKILKLHFCNILQVTEVHFGETTNVDLKHNGGNVSVTMENR